jgi:hypothetical protein
MNNVAKHPEPGLVYDASPHQLEEFTFRHTDEEEVKKGGKPT